MCATHPSNRLQVRPAVREHSGGLVRVQEARRDAHKGNQEGKTLTHCQENGQKHREIIARYVRT